jgi:hypothetical protein
MTTPLLTTRLVCKLITLLRLRGRKVVLQVSRALCTLNVEIYWPGESDGIRLQQIKNVYNAQKIITILELFGIPTKITIKKNR